jgi:hypothetical protein
MFVALIIKRNMNTMDGMGILWRQPSAQEGFEMPRGSMELFGYQTNNSNSISPQRSVAGRSIFRVMRRKRTFI